MAYDETLAARIRDALVRKKNIQEKKLFGGVGYLLNGNMLVGVWKDSLDRAGAEVREGVAGEVAGQQNGNTTKAEGHRRLHLEVPRAEK